MKRLSTLGLAVASLAFASAAQAVTYTYSGATALAGPTFNRPSADGSVLSGLATAVHYDAFSFSVSAAGSYTFLSTNTSPPDWDNFILLYSPTFVRASGLTNFKTGADDGPGGVGTPPSFTFTLATGTNYVFVTTGFGNTDVGAYVNTIIGPGNVITSAVPEPTVYALMALGLVGLGLAKRRRQ
jgi:PEP-CTERM motif